MSCVKKINRSINSLLSIFLCERCQHKQSDESFVIGTNVLHIYCINQCAIDEITDETILFSDKVKLLLRDFCLHYQDNIILWMDDIEPLEYYEVCWEILFMMEMDIHILKW